MTIDDDKLSTELKRGGTNFFDLFLKGTESTTSQGVVADLEEAIGAERTLLRNTLFGQGTSINVVG